MDRLGAIVLCGGRSVRMGGPKAWLPVGDEVFLQRVVRLVSTRAPVVVVSAAEGQPLPALPGSVEVVRDAEPGRGPLLGLASGLDALSGRVDWAFATGCDAPLLEPRWIDRLLERAGGGSELVLPHVEGRDQPLAALYRPGPAARAARALLAQGRGRLGSLREALRTRVVLAEELADVDPGFRTIRNINTPEAYRALLGLG